MGAPATLPADFFDKQSAAAPQSSPDVLPADFFDDPNSNAQPKRAEGLAFSEESGASHQSAAPNWWDKAKAAAEAVPAVIGALTHKSTEMMGTPLVPESVVPYQQPKTAPQAIAHGAGEFARGMTSPENIGLAALTGPVEKIAPLLSRAVGGVFSAQLLKGAYDQYPEIKDAVDKGDWTRAAGAITTAVLSGGLGVAAGVHAVRGGGEAPPRTPQPTPADRAVQSAPAGVEALTPGASPDVLPPDFFEKPEDRAAAPGNAHALPAAPDVLPPDFFDEQQATEANSTVDAARSTPREPSTPPAYGRDANILVPGETTTYPARYAVRELADMQPSHNPINFEPNPNYDYVNDRDYSQQLNAARVVKNAAPDTFNPDYPTTDSPTAEHGAPIIDASGNVLGGNSRTMTLARVYQRGGVDAEMYRGAIADKAAQFGLDPAELDRFKQPVLVREVGGDVDAPRAITDFNKAAAAELTPEERAVSDGRRLSPETVQDIAGRLDDLGDQGTLAEALRGDNGGEVLQRLVRDGVLTPQEQPGYLDDRGNLTPDAKSRIAKALMGRFFDTPADYRETTPAMRAKLERIAPQLLRVEGRSEWNLTEATREAIALSEDARVHKMPIEDVAAQSVIGGDRRYSPDAISIAKTLEQGPVKASSAFRRYANDEALSRQGSQGAFFEPPTRAEAFRDAFRPGEALPTEVFTVPADNGGYLSVAANADQSIAAKTRGGPTRELDNWNLQPEYLDMHVGPAPWREELAKRGLTPDNVVGLAAFQKVPYEGDQAGADQLKSKITVVSPEYRRQGIASRMYDEAQRVSGLEAAPSANVTEDAEKFWAARQPQGASAHERPGTQIATGREIPVVLQDFVANRGGFAEPARLTVRSARDVSADEVRRAFFPDLGPDKLDVQKLRPDDLMAAAQPGRQPFRLQFLGENGRHVSAPEGIEERLGLQRGEQYHRPPAPEAESTLSPALAGAGERGSATLAPIAERLKAKFPEGYGGEPRSNYSGLGAARDKFVRNLSQLEEASPTAHAAAVRAATSRAQSAALLRSAMPRIEEALGSDVTPADFRRALIESRLEGLRDRWQEMARDPRSVFANDPDRPRRLLELLNNIEGKRGLPQDLRQTAAALIEQSDVPTLESFLRETFNDAASHVAHAIEPNEFAAVRAKPGFQQGLATYKQLLERPLAENHALNEGVFSDALGPLDTYYPLVPLRGSEEIMARAASRRPFTKPRNIANQFATGLADEYDPGVAALGERIQTALRTNNKAALINTLEQEGLLHPLGQGEQAGDAIEVHGQAYRASVVETAPARTIIKDGRVVTTRAGRALIPEWLDKELAPILQAKDLRIKVGLAQHLADAITAMSLLGPTDATAHANNILGTLVANTPFVGHALASAPFMKRFTALVKVATTDPATPEAAVDLNDMAKLGLLPERFASETFSKRAAEQMGAERKFTLGPLLYGPNGLDVRARLVMYRLAKQMNPDVTPLQLYKFVNQLGNYTRQLQSEIERSAKSSGMSPFYTAGSQMVRNGVNAFLGTGPMPKSGVGVRIAQQLTGGAVGTVALWASAYRAYTGQWPWEDKRSKFLKIPVNQGDRESWLGRKLWGDDPRATGYVDFGYFNPLVARGGRALGISPAFDTAMAGGNARQIREATATGPINAITHPFMGPPARAAFVGLTGESPYITGLRDREGRPGLQLLPADTKGSSFPHLGAAVREVSGIQGRLGEATGFLPGTGMPERGNPYFRMVADLVLPGLVANATNTVGKSKALARERHSVDKAAAREH